MNFIFYLILSVLFLIYYFFKRKFAYWYNRGVPFVRPSIPFGNFKDVGKTKHFSTALVEFYNDLKGKFPYGGIFMFIRPIVFVTDLDLIKKILIRDFNYFTDHGVYVNEKDDPLSYNLFSMDGPQWKTLRNKLSPTFTSGKMKMMFPIIAGVGVELKKCIDSAIEKNSEVEIKDIVGRFTTDVIGTCAFGIECNSLENPNNIFREMTRKHFEEPVLKGYKLLLVVISEYLAKKFGIKLTHDDVAKFFTKVVEDTIEYRETSDVKRNDFLNLLLQLKNKGKLDDDDSTGEKSDFITKREIISQSFLFFGAGFETSSTTLSFAMAELVAYPQIQEKLRNEINLVLEKHDGKITYESISEMKYLEQVIYETLRKHPVLPFTDRIAIADYAVPDTKTIVEKGRKIFIPIYAIQRDPEYYPEPDKFDPERFTPEAVKKRHAMTFLSFGDGPRLCIGQRFGLMQVKIGLVSLIRNYKWSKTSKTVYPVKYSFSNIALLLSPAGGVYIKAEKI